MIMPLHIVSHRVRENCVHQNRVGLPCSARCQDGVRGWRLTHGLSCRPFLSRTSATRPTARPPTSSREHIFPGGHLPSMGAMVDAARGTASLFRCRLEQSPPAIAEPLYSGRQTSDSLCRGQRSAPHRWLSLASHAAAPTEQRAVGFSFDQITCRTCRAEPDASRRLC